MTGGRRTVRPIAWVAVYSVAMAYAEAAVVVYLRALYYPDGFAFPLAPMPPGLAAAEIGREAATLVMLLGVAMLAGRDPRERFLAFCVSFGVWDLFYYAWLWLLLRWPPSLLTWDVLFLIPVPWIGPVFAPVIVSILLVAGGLLLLRDGAGRGPVAIPLPLRLLALAGALLVLASFMLDFRVVIAGTAPPPFRWGLFGTGVALATAALVLALRGGSRRPPRKP